ncbi:MAG: VCBS repeat-containing protein, partial [Verrucomicrobia bacterium]|nr:VCBS repeat-containing protein [Verrucomicrobiota bacterium]
MRLHGELSAQPGPGFKSAPVKVTTGKTGFARLDSSATGIAFTNRLSDDRSLSNRNLLSGSGVAAGDVDGDGLYDLYFCGLDSDNVLYRNLGNWRFEDITAAAGVASARDDATAAAFADIDGDGDLDLLVNSLGGGTRIFQNDGKARFQEITAQSGVASKAGSMSMALADIEGDGDLDLYVANFRPTTIQDQITTRFSVRPIGDRHVVTHVNGQPATSPEFTNRFVVTPAGSVLELGEADFLFLNDGKGKFTVVPFTDGAFLDEKGRPLREPPRDWGLAVQFHDINVDGAPDIYVCNDLYTPDRIWINDGRGRFRALDNLSLRDTSTFSMGVDFADIDRDGAVDFFVVDMLSRDHVNRHVQISQSRSGRAPPGPIDLRLQQLRNTLLVNRGDTTFAEISFYSGVEASEWSWGPIFLDVDLDGYEDILVTNGQLRDFQNADMATRYESAKTGKQLTPSEAMSLIRFFPDYKSPNMIFRNRGDLTFEEVGAAWGFNAIGISQGMALADLDNDGDLDVVMNNLNEVAGVFRNEGSAPRVAVRLKG